MAKLFRAISSSELAAELRKVIPQLQEISAGKVSIWMKGFSIGPRDGS